MYAIFETGGKQYTAKVGDQLYIEKVEVEAGSMIAFNKVLALGEEGKLDVDRLVEEALAAMETVEI